MMPDFPIPQTTTRPVFDLIKLTAFIKSSVSWQDKFAIAAASI
jgi:hypothetical protein